MYPPPFLKLVAVPLITLSLAACFSSSKTRYRPDPATERALAEAREALDKTTAEVGEDFAQQRVADTVSIRTVPRRTGQLFRFGPNFSPDAGGSWSVNTNYTIANQGVPNPSRLRINQDPVLYPRDGTDRRVFFRQQRADDEFAARGTIFRTEFYYDGHPNYFDDLLGTGDTGNQHSRFAIQGTDDEDTTKWRNWEAKALASFQFMAGTEGGMVMRFGGDDSGELIYGDLETYVAKGCAPATPACNAPNTHDIEISFGQPFQNAFRDFAYYWDANLPHVRRDATGEEVAVPGEQPARRPGTLIGPSAANGLNAGTYQLELTHSTDPVTTLEANRYLSYAAYGLFNFVDAYTANKRPGRMQTIHYGLDAFADANNMRTGDLPAGIEGATFKGRTIAYLVHTQPSGNSGPNQFRNLVSFLTRLRGNITLTANIGPGTDNSISGTIDGMEHFQNNTKAWTRDNVGLTQVGGFSFQHALGRGHENDGGTLLLQNGAIAADGSFKGDVVPGPQYVLFRREGNDGDPSAYFGTGQFEGSLYGPSDGLETAGTWWIPTRHGRGREVGGIIGSFGACQDDKGRC